MLFIFGHGRKIDLIKGSGLDQLGVGRRPVRARSRETQSQRIVVLEQSAYDALDENGIEPFAHFQKRDLIRVVRIERAVVEYPNYERAIIVSSDGDFYSLVEHLYKDKKLETVLAARSQSCSSLLKQKAKERIQFLDRLRAKLERRG